MKKAITAILTVMYCAFLACSCFAESDYDPRSEGYFMMSTIDETALAFADDFATSNLGLYQQFGVKTALYIFDSLEGMDINDDAMEAVLSIHEAAVSDTSNDMIILIVLDEDNYKFWLGESVKEKCTEDALQEVIDAVESEGNDTIWTEVAKAYVGVSYRMLGWSIGNSTADAD